jgi:glycerol uptake facilitator-like aquaporin
MNWTKYLVEFLGTAFFIYVILATGNPLAIGLALTLAILMSANVSGGMINPAVTIVMVSAGKLETSELVPYCLAQVLGGLTALELYKRVQV